MTDLDGIPVMDRWVVTHSLAPRRQGYLVSVAEAADVLLKFEVSNPGPHRMVELLSPCCNDVILVMGALMRTSAGPICGACHGEVYRSTLTVADRDAILSRWRSAEDLCRFLERLLGNLSDPLAATVLVEAIFRGCPPLRDWGQ